MMLTPKQEKFCQLVAEGKDYSTAYRGAYNTGTMKPESINSKASELMRNVKITSRLAELNSELAQRSLWTREDSVNALISVIKQPDTTADIVRAVKELNNMHGYAAPKQLEITSGVADMIRSARERIKK